MSDIKIILDERAFQLLIRGEVLNAGNGVKIILQDVGFDRMIELIKKEME